MGKALQNAAGGSVSSRLQRSCCPPGCFWRKPPTGQWRPSDGGWGVARGACKCSFQIKVFLEMRISKCLAFVLWPQYDLHFRMAPALLGRATGAH